jgi:hypothetical protein
MKPNQKESERIDIGDYKEKNLDNSEIYLRFLIINWVKNDWLTPPNRTMKVVNGWSITTHRGVNGKVFDHFTVSFRGKRNRTIKEFNFNSTTKQLT